MYTYKYVKTKHSSWSGKPKESIEGIIDENAALGWRFVQVVTLLHQELRRFLQ